MKRLLALTAAALCLSAPAFAGDKPVITVKPPYFEYFYGTHGPIRYYTRGNLGTTAFDGPVAATAGVATPAAAPGATGQAVNGATLTRVQSDALYARLLAEAKNRKLR